jgi:hypothetical protein
MRVHGRVVPYALGFGTFALAVAQGCGGNVTSLSSGSAHGTGGGSGTGGASTGSASTGSMGTGGAGGSCVPFSEPPGTMCPSTLQCKTTTISCSCSGDATSCDEPDTGTNDVHPPKSRPPEGGCCDTEGLVCGGYEACGPICRCTNGAWACQAPDVCPKFGCPADLFPLEGQRCEPFVGQVCATCPLVCTCTLQPDGGALWECWTPPC